ncbi:hypothetical protein CAPTEDRAFT_192391 [Capitella teleta]|uniref:F5/8 type C domain-containing protein n=1 Tax=Capitella teleta TaxID=283909 RepID=R7TTL1_CAPTE|nr:hypothetical protein CAPTEDRAFT_192391 [Capitella teleta]|eukprot:ELT97253.1 hypothetical protein CAPTEDRAFT_192391 [Capitella teleta]
MMTLVLSGLTLLVGLDISTASYSVDCLNLSPLIENGVKDIKLTASNSYQTYFPSESRMSGFSWCTEEVGPWMQIDLGYSMSIIAIDTMGYEEEEIFVKTYKLQSSEDGKTWMWYKNEENPDVCMKIFEGNIDEINVVRNYFDPPIQARFMKFYPLEFKTFICVRWELYTCQIHVAPSVVSSGETFAAEDALPSVYSIPESHRRAIPQDIMDGNSSTCIGIPMVGQPPQELSIRLDGNGILTTFSLHGNGIQCDEGHVVAMSRLTSNCCGESKLCTLAEGADECQVTCTAQFSSREFSVLLYLTADIGGSHLCEVRF